MPAKSAAQTGPVMKVVLAGDHERRRYDRRELGAQVEGGEDLVVEEEQRVGDGHLAAQCLEVSALGVAVAGEVERELADGQLAELLVGLEAARLLVLEGLTCVGVPRLGGFGVHGRLHHGLLLGREAGERAGQDEPLDPVRMGGRVRGGDHAAVRVAEEEHPLQPEVHSQLVEVGDVVGGW